MKKHKYGKVVKVIDCNETVEIIRERGRVQTMPTYAMGGYLAWELLKDRAVELMNKNYKEQDG